MKPRHNDDDDDDDGAKGGNIQEKSCETLSSSSSLWSFCLLLKRRAASRCYSRTRNQQGFSQVQCYRAYIKRVNEPLWQREDKKHYRVPLRITQMLKRVNL